MATLKNWKQSPYYVKRFFSLLDVCRKDDADHLFNTLYSVKFEVNGKRHVYQVCWKNVCLLERLLRKAYTDGVDFGFNLMRY